MNTLKHLVLALWLGCCASGARGDSTFGIGLFLGADGEHIVVRGIVPDSPASAQKSISVGDRIVAIAQGAEAPVRLQGVKVEQAVALLRGERGTPVRLTVTPTGGDDSQARVVSFVRGELKEFADWGDGKLLAKGQKMPDIEMICLPSGKVERLSDHAGKIVVLEFWATWCGPCQVKMAELQGYPQKHPGWKDDVVLISASVDEEREAATKHLEKKGWMQSHNVWVRTDAIKACHIQAVPAVYIMGREGRIIAADPENVPEVVNHELHKEGRSKAKQP